MRLEEFVQLISNPTAKEVEMHFCFVVSAYIYWDQLFLSITNKTEQSDTTVNRDIIQIIRCSNTRESNFHSTAHIKIQSTLFGQTHRMILPSVQTK